MVVVVKLINKRSLLKSWAIAPEKMVNGLDGAVKATSVFITGLTKINITTGEGMWKPPIKTGQMRLGVQPQKLGRLKAMVSTSRRTPYAVFVHDGTKKMRARPFFEITAKRGALKIQKFFGSYMDKVIKDIFR